MSENTVYCVYCDAENRANAERCVNCGRILDWTAGDNTPSD